MPRYILNRLHFGLKCFPVYDKMLINPEHYEKMSEYSLSCWDYDDVIK